MYIVYPKNLLIVYTQCTHKPTLTDTNYMMYTSKLFADMFVYNKIIESQLISFQFPFQYFQCISISLYLSLCVLVFDRLFYINRMGNLLIGGHMVFYYMKCLWASHHSMVKMKRSYLLQSPITMYPIQKA